MAKDKTVNELVINKLTQAQYDAIPEAERSDTELYFITDANEDTLTKTEAAETYLPLSGGEVTGRIAFNTPPVPNASVPIIAFSKNSSVNLFIANSASGVPNNLGVKGNFVVTDNISTNSLGNTSKKVETAYIKTLNNGADLDIPTVGGTLARVEDIPEDIQLETLPVASADNLNKIYQYVGETTSDYVNGYFYKSTNAVVQDWFTTGYAQYDTSLTLIITVDKEKFLAQNPVWQDAGEGIKIWRADYNESSGEWFVWTQDPNIYISNADLKDIWGIDVTNAAGDYVPANGDTLLIQITESEGFIWKSIDVQEKNTTTIPQHPTTPGAYTLMCYVDENGSASYAWESVA